MGLFADKYIKDLNTVTFKPENIKPYQAKTEKKYDIGGGSNGLNGANAEGLVGTVGDAVSFSSSATSTLILSSRVIVTEQY